MAWTRVVFTVNILTKQRLEFPQNFGKINYLFQRGHEGAGAFFTETQVFLQCNAWLWFDFQDFRSLNRLYLRSNRDSRGVRRHLQPEHEAGQWGKDQPTRKVDHTHHCHNNYNHHHHHHSSSSSPPPSSTRKVGHTHHNHHHCIWVILKQNLTWQCYQCVGAGAGVLWSQKYYGHQNKHKNLASQCLSLCRGWSASASWGSGKVVIAGKRCQIRMFIHALRGGVKKTGIFYF